MIDCHVIFICEMFICEISSESTRDDLVSQSSASLERIRHVMWWYWCLIYTKQKIVSLLITRLCNMRGRHRERIKSWIGVCVLCIFKCIFPFRAATVLAQVEPSLAKLLGGRELVLPFSGIGHFRKEVVFVGLAPGQHRHTLDSLAGQWQSFSLSLSLCPSFFFCPPSTPLSVCPSS